MCVCVCVCVSLLECCLEEILVALVAEVIDAIAENIGVDGKEWQVHVMAQFGNDCAVVEGRERQDDEIVENGRHAHEHDPGMYPPLGPVCHDNISG